MERSSRKQAFVGTLFVDFTKAFDTVSHNILLQKLNGDMIDWNQRRYLAVVKELPYRTKAIRQNQRMRLRYTHYNSRSAARVSPRTHVNLALHKRPPKITTLSGNLSVCRRDNNILYRRNDGFANRETH